MASLLVNVCRFNPTAGGTTDWTYSSAVTGYQSPAAAGAVNGGVYSYRAESANLSQWEVGFGTYNSGTGVLTRNTVLFNSAGTTSKINFSAAPQVAIIAAAEDLLPIASVQPITASLGADVNLNNTANYFAGPAVAQGSIGTWFASGAVTCLNSAIASGFDVKLWDGTTVIDSRRSSSAAAGFSIAIPVSGFITSPAGNIRIDVRDVGSTNGQIKFNLTGSSKDSTLTAYRIR
jgi:hypothetical protein